LAAYPRSLFESQSRITNPDGQAQEIISYLKRTPPLERDAVERAFTGVKDYFRGNMFRIAGSIVEAGLVEESDDDIGNEVRRQKDFVAETESADLENLAEEEAGPTEVDLVPFLRSLRPR
jgi:hypothetical protein